MMGTVKWFSSEKGYGFIAGQDGEDYFCHYSDISGEGWKNLTEKQTVTFEIGADKNGRTSATNVQVVEPDA